MKRRIKNTSGIYEYLETCGVLETGTDKELEEARKEYWKKYRATYQRQKRKEQNAFTVLFNKKEMRLLKPVVQKHHSNYTRFIKQATLAYIQQQFVVIDPASVNQIRELLTKNYTTIQNIEERFPVGYSRVSLTKQFADLEQEIQQALYNPKTLEEAIRTSITSDPDSRYVILKILES